jgi:diacylglycerol kinase family enzyme
MVEYFRTEAAHVSVVEGEDEVLVQTDGEVAGRLPLDCRVVPRALRIVIP